MKKLSPQTAKKNEQTAGKKAIKTETNNKTSDRRSFIRKAWDPYCQQDDYGINPFLGHSHGRDLIYVNARQSPKDYF